MLDQILKDPNLGIPGLGSKFGPSTRLGDILSQALSMITLLAAFLSFIWFVWGAFHYIFAGGDKEQLAKARSRMTWAIVGLFLTLLAYLIAQFVAEILKPAGGLPI